MCPMPQLLGPEGAACLPVLASGSSGGSGVASSVATILDESCFVQLHRLLANQGVVPPPVALALRGASPAFPRPACF